MPKPAAWQMVKMARCFLIATQSRNRTTSSGMRMIGSFSDFSSRDQLCHASVLFEGHPIEEAKRGRGYADRTYPQLLFVGQGFSQHNSHIRSISNVFLELPQLCFSVVRKQNEAKFHDHLC